MPVQAVGWKSVRKSCSIVAFVASVTSVASLLLICGRLVCHCAFSLCNSSLALQWWKEWEQRWCNCKRFWLAEQQEVRGSIPGLAAIGFQRLVISCFQVVIWLKYRYLKRHKSLNQPTTMMENHGFMAHAVKHSSQMRIDM